MTKPDLVALWEAHCRYEFETRDVDATMATMVATPYVNHIPTMTGGVGHDELKRFYKYHFIQGNPPDLRLTPISRTVSIAPTTPGTSLRIRISRGSPSSPFVEGTTPKSSGKHIPSGSSRFTSKA